MLKQLLVFGAGLALAGCNIGADLSPQARGSLGAAGFRQVLDSRDDILSDFTFRGAWVCPKSRCGDDVAFLAASFSADELDFDRPSVSLEQAIRSGRISESAIADVVRRGLTLAAARKGGGVALSGAKVSVYRPTPVVRVSGALTSGGRKGKAFFVSKMQFVGDDMRVLVAVSDSSAAAARYARMEWMN